MNWHKWTRIKKILYKDLLNLKTLDKHHFDFFDKIEMKKPFLSFKISPFVRKVEKSTGGSVNIEPVNSYIFSLQINFTVIILYK